MPIVELVLKFLFADFIFPLALDIAQRRESDPDFKKQSDETYSALKASTTSKERKSAARKLYELQKGS